MPFRVVAYVAAVSLAAVAVFIVLFHSLDQGSVEYSWGPVLLVAVGAYASRNKYRTARSRDGEISFIPYLSAVVLSPSWETVALVGAAVGAIELTKQKLFLKRIFNAFQFLLSASCAALIYLALGGVSLAADSSFQLLPHTAAVLTFLLVNELCVAGVIALAEQKRFIPIVVAAQRSTVLYDVAAIPGVYGVARAYTDWGGWGVFVTVLALYGVRLMYQAKLQLENTNRELLELFVHTVEFRDPYTSGHSQRVARFSRVIARAVGLPTKEVQRIGRAALLHDVGKIHEVFAPILSKPGKLTPEERAIMELHPVKSAELVAKLSDFEDIVADVRHHHERFDGMGYPDRLRGKAIPIGSRIIAFADTIDAMTTDRPYRKGMTAEEVRAELIRCRGEQFDPDICDALINSPVFGHLFDGSDEGPSLSITQVLTRVRRTRTPVPV